MAESFHSRNARADDGDGEGVHHREPPLADPFERCPECRAAGSIEASDESEEAEGICLACSVHLRRSLADGHWKVRAYGG